MMDAILMRCLFLLAIAIMVSCSDPHVRSRHNCTSFTDIDVFPRIMVINGASSVGIGVVKRLKELNFKSVKASVNDIKSVGILNNLISFEHDICMGDFMFTTDSRSYLQYVDWVIHVPSDLEGLTRNTNSVSRLSSFSRKSRNDFKVLTAINHYALSKYVFIGSAQRMSHWNEQVQELKHDRNVSVVKILNVYGAGYDDFQDAHSVSSLIKDAITKPNLYIGYDPLVNKDYVYLSDVVNAVVLAVQADPFKDDLAIGTGMRTSLLEITRHIEKLTKKCLNKDAPPSYNELKVYEYDEHIAETKRAKKLLQGWTPKVSVEHGIALNYAEILRNLAKGKASSYKPEELESFAKCFDDVARSKEQEKWVPTPIQLSGKHTFIPPVPGEVSVVLPKMFCPKDRKAVHESFKDVTLPRKTLVVVIASTRASRITWENFKVNVLDELNADLALSVESPKFAGKDGFRDNAKYVWTMNDPDGNDYVHFYNEISNQCYGHGFNNTYAEIIGTIAKTGSGWLGCIHATKHISCCASILFFRWFAMQNIIRHKLYLQYDTVVVTRSDFYWVTKHQHINGTQGTVYVPDGEGFGGLYDRHYILHMKDAVSALAHAEIVVEDPDPYKQLQHLVDLGLKDVGNLEGVHNIWLTKIQKLDVKRFLHSGLLVRDGSDPGLERWSGGIPSDINGHKILAKYGDEILVLRRNGAVKTGNF